ncbi:MAG: bifunctional ornithine acetyltransferase/N-acetylglutamate synthase [Oscillospiraceae bacterium]|nr:bifunctional ornithine acetyltransferase/N-acetylglutamate synthase [Oscillospiraceae bacterium]
MKFIKGGVCAAKGFSAAGLHVGVKTKNKDKKDIALIVSEAPCHAAAVYTKNIVKAAPLHVTQSHLSDGKARAVFANSGNANACAPRGIENAVRMCKAIAAELNIETEDVIVASTGVIGQELPIEIIESGVSKLAASLNSGADGSKDAAHAIMTTDLTVKEAAAEFEAGGKTLKIGGIAKGSGMIHPNMGTMLAFLTTDCAISADMIQKALKDAANISFNRVSVDGDSSTNDMLTLMANGLGGNEEITKPGADYDSFTKALGEVCIQLAKMIASDGEGATHLITCKVKGAPSETIAEIASKSVISSTLVKAAMFGADANWGRILCAMGYSGASFDPEKVNVAFESAAGRVQVCENGKGLAFDEDTAKKILTEHEIIIDIDMQSGEKQCICWGCDITYDYIKINGDYRT